MARESSFWKWLRGKILPLGHFTRIESEVTSGVPDVHYATLGASYGWLELKSVKAPKTPKARPLLRKGLREEQIAWIHAHYRMGVPVGIVVKIGREVFLISGYHAGELNGLTLEEIRAISYEPLKLGENPKWIRSKFLAFLRALKKRS